MARVYCDWHIISRTAKLILVVIAKVIWFGCLGFAALCVSATV